VVELFPVEWTFYVPPGTVPIREIGPPSDRKVSFSAEVFDVLYRFEGEFGENELDGVFSVNPPAAPKTQTRVTLVRYPPQEQHSAEWARGGLYSNSVVSNESGDLHGIQLVILDTSPLIDALQRALQQYLDNQRQAIMFRDGTSIDDKAIE
jgi:hypothetical protein